MEQHSLQNEKFIPFLKRVLLKTEIKTLMRSIPDLSARQLKKEMFREEKFAFFSYSEGSKMIREIHMNMRTSDIKEDLLKKCTKVVDVFQMSTRRDHKQALPSCKVIVEEDSKTLYTT